MTRLTPLGADLRALDLTPDAAGGAAAPGSNSRRTCKFLLIEYHDVVQLVFGDVTSYRYHANLLHRYCLQHGIAASWVREPDLLEPLDTALRILGGGFLELNHTQRKAVFSGASKAYGAFPWQHLKSILAVSPVFAGMTIRIDL